MKEVIEALELCIRAIDLHDQIESTEEREALEIEAVRKAKQALKLLRPEVDGVVWRLQDRKISLDRWLSKNKAVDLKVDIAFKMRQGRLEDGRDYTIEYGCVEGNDYEQVLSVAIRKPRGEDH